MRACAAFAAACAVALAAPAAADAVELRSGPLTVRRSRRSRSGSSSAAPASRRSSRLRDSSSATPTRRVGTAAHAPATCASRESGWWASSRRTRATIALELAPAGRGVIALRATPAASAQAVGIGFEAPHRGALLRLRLALRRGRSPRARRRELRRGRPDTRVRPQLPARVRPSVGARRTRRLHLLPGPLASVEPGLRPPDRPRRAQPVPPGHRACRRLEPRGRRARARAARLRRADALGRVASLHRRHRAPAPAADALDIRPVVPDRPAEPRRAGRGGADHRRAAGRGRARLGGGDADALPALRGPARRPRVQRRAHGPVPRGGARAPRVLQPVALRLLPAGLG